MSDLGESLDLAADEIDQLRDQIKELTRKGEELCCQNGSILVENYNLRAILKRALNCHYPQQLAWMTDAEKLLGVING